MTANNEMKSRRGATRYKINPFVETAALATSTRIRRIADRSGEKLMVVNANDGEILAPAGFWHEQTVDKTQFVKLYINGVKAFKELTGAGTRVFELLYLQVQRNIGKDRVVLSFNEIDQTATTISEATFYRGMRELVEKQFIAESLVPSQYFVNPDYMWNGDRLAFVRAYRLNGSKHRDEHTADLFDAPLSPPTPMLLPEFDAEARDERARREVLAAQKASKQPTKASARATPKDAPSKPQKPAANKR